MRLSFRRRQCSIVESRPGRVEALEPRRLLSAALLKDVNASPYGSVPTSFAAYHDALFFSAIVPGVGAELVRTSAVPGPVQVVADVNPGELSSGPAHLNVAGDTLYFSAFTPAAGNELWKTDGTAEGTVLVNDLLP